MPRSSSEILFFSEGIKFSVPKAEANRKWLRQLAKLHRHKIKSLNYIFTSDRFLLGINRAYLSHNTFTDIITFNTSEEKSNKFICGEIYISIPRVRENAKKFGAEFSDELHRVMAHGLLHLCGLNDKSPSERKAMRDEEEKALDLLLK